MGVTMKVKVEASIIPEFGESEKYPDLKFKRRLFRLEISSRSPVVEAKVGKNMQARYKRFDNPMIQGMVETVSPVITVYELMGDMRFFSWLIEEVNRVNDEHLA